MYLCVRGIDFVEWSCICVLGVSIWPLSTIVLLIFFNVPTQSLPRIVGPYTLSNLCQRLYAKNLGKIRLLKGNLT